MYNNIENIECTVKLQSGKTDGNPSDLDKHDANSYPNSEKNGKIVNIKTKKSNVFSRKKQIPWYRPFSDICLKIVVIVEST